MIRIRGMTVDDLPLGMRLKQQAGWNQTEADWRRLLDLEPAGCFVAELDGLPAATLATCLFGPVAWIAMVLVKASLRRRGLGHALMAHALKHLEHLGVRTVRLDATPLGQPLYEKLGFVVEYRLARYAGIVAPVSRAPRQDERVTPARAEDLDDLVALDGAVTGTDRRRLLQRLLAERPESARVVRKDAQITGFLMSRPGSRAVQIGPCVATADAGRWLLQDAWERFRGENVYVDIPIGNGAASVAEAAGLTPERELTRMRRGPGLNERLEDLWTSFGPEKG